MSASSDENHEMSAYDSESSDEIKEPPLKRRRLLHGSDDTNNSKNINDPNNVTLSKSCIDSCIERLSKCNENILPDLVVLRQEMQRKKSKKEQANLLLKIERAGVLVVLVDTVATLPYDEDTSQILSVLMCLLREFIVKQGRHEIVIDRALYWKKCLPTPTCGILGLLTALAHCKTMRHLIVNEQTLNYLLSSIHLDSLGNNDASLRLILEQSRLLLALMRFEHRICRIDIRGFRTGFIIDILHAFLNVENVRILRATLGCFITFVNSKKLVPCVPVPLHCLSKITDLLVSNHKEIVTVSITALVVMMSRDEKSVTLDHLASNVELFLQCNIFKKLHIALSEFIPIIDDSHLKTIVHLCWFVERCFESVADDIAQYMIHSFIENNMMQFIMQIIQCISSLETTRRFKFIWMIMHHANEQQLYFLIICQDIIAYMCNKNAYSKVMGLVSQIHTKGWKSQIAPDTPMHVRNLILSVFEKVLKSGEDNQQWNDGKNVCLESMIKYNGIGLVTLIRQEVVDNTENETTEQTDKILKRCNDILEQLREENDDSCGEMSNAMKAELIVSCFVREYYTESMQKIPLVIAIMIKQFYLVKCDFCVPYLQYQMGVDRMVIKNTKIKQCGSCSRYRARADRNMPRLRCSWCRHVHYCGTKCQAKDWTRQHQTACDKINKIRNACDKTFCNTVRGNCAKD
eukprot:55583_1